MHRTLLLIRAASFWGMVLLTALESGPAVSWLPLLTSAETAVQGRLVPAAETCSPANANPEPSCATEPPLVQVAFLSSSDDRLDVDLVAAPGRLVIDRTRDVQFAAAHNVCAELARAEVPLTILLQRLVI